VAESGSVQQLLTAECADQDAIIQGLQSEAAVMKQQLERCMFESVCVFVCVYIHTYKIKTLYVCMCKHTYYVRIFMDL
jgi:hypothetical protein